MNPFAEFESPAAELDGIRVVIRSRRGAGEMTFIIRRAGGGNRAFAYAMHARSKRVEHIVKAADEHPEDVALQIAKTTAQIEVAQEAFGDAVLIGWETVDGPDGQPLPFARDTAVDLLRRCPDIWEELQQAAVDEEAFRAAGVAKDGTALGKP